MNNSIASASATTAPRDSVAAAPAAQKTMPSIQPTRFIAVGRWNAHARHANAAISRNSAT